MNNYLLTTLPKGHTFEAYMIGDWLYEAVLTVGVSHYASHFNLFDALMRETKDVTFVDYDVTITLGIGNLVEILKTQLEYTCGESFDKSLMSTLMRPDNMIGALSDMIEIHKSSYDEHRDAGAYEEMCGLMKSLFTLVIMFPSDLGELVLQESYWFYDKYLEMNQ